MSKQLVGSQQNPTQTISTRFHKLQKATSLSYWRVWVTRPTSSAKQQMSRFYPVTKISHSTTVWLGETLLTNTTTTTKNFKKK